MPIPLFFKGCMIGLCLAAPVGPIGILCIHRSLTDRFAAGISVGLGAAFADAIYGLIAALGLTAISSFLIQHLTALRLIGGFFLGIFGTIILLRPVKQGNSTYKPGNLLGTSLSTFFLTLTNPVTIFAFAVVFAGLGLGEVIQDYSSAILLTTGVFLGSLVWFIILSAIANFFKAQCNLTTLQWVNRVSGIILICFGLGAILSILKI